MDTFDKIEALLRQKDMSYADLARGTGISTGLISQWKKRSQVPSLKKLSLVASFFGVPLDYLSGNDSRDNAHPSPSVPGSKWVPVLGSVPAGTPVEAIEEILDYEEITPKMALDGEYFGLKIKGDSMEPKISNGDVIIVRKQEDVDSGDIAVVLVNGDEATIKRIKKEAGGIMLIPNNPAYEPKFYTYDDVQSLPVRIIGKVVELRAKF